MERLEVWKDVVGYEGLYQVSNLGRVKSIGHKNNHKDEIILKQSSNYIGYKVVTLCKDKVQKEVRVHRLVAIAFIENPQNKPYVNHIDGIKDNNHVSNLEWTTQKENMHHASKSGLLEKNALPRKHWKKVKQLNKNGEVVKIFKSMGEASRETGCSVRGIRDCLKHPNRSNHGWRWAIDE